MVKAASITGHIMILSIWDSITPMEGVVLAVSFLSILIGIICFALPTQRKTGVNIFRLLVGLLFIYSGFVKADDPMGFTIKLQEYFAQDALNLPSLDKFALTFSIII